MGGQGGTPVLELCPRSSCPWPCPRPSARRGSTAGLRALEPPHPPGLQLQPHSSGLGKEPVLPPSAWPEGPAPECGAKSPRATARTCGSNGPWGIPADLDLPAAPVGGAAWDMPPGERSGRLSPSHTQGQRCRKAPSTPNAWPGHTWAQGPVPHAETRAPPPRAAPRGTCGRRKGRCRQVRPGLSCSGRTACGAKTSGRTRSSLALPHRRQKSLQNTCAHCPGLEPSLPRQPRGPTGHLCPGQAKWHF